MSKQFALNDASVVVVIGSGAVGGTFANEFAQKGIDVVCLEAGKRLALSDVVNDPAVMMQKLGWNDPRKGTPIYTCKTVGGGSSCELHETRRPVGHERRSATSVELHYVR